MIRCGVLGGFRMVDAEDGFLDAPGVEEAWWASLARRGACSLPVWLGLCDDGGEYYVSELEAAMWRVWDLSGEAVGDG